MIKDSDRRRAAREFFRQELKDLDAASKAVVKSTARALKRETLAQLRKFKVGPHGNKGFQRAVKLYDWNPRGSMGPASLVRLGVPFMSAFEEGATVSGRLVILLNTGAALGFRRITKGNPWPKVWAKISKAARMVRVSNGVIVLLKTPAGEVPIYKFQRSVKLPKKLSFKATAEKLAAQMPEEIKALLEGKTLTTQ